MNCNIEIITSCTGYSIYVVYIIDEKIIHSDLIKMYDVSMHGDKAVKQVVKDIFKYKSLGIDVNVVKNKDINNMCNLNRLLKALEF